jgi:hypothetical protein
MESATAVSLWIWPGTRTSLSSLVLTQESTLRILHYEMTRPPVEALAKVRELPRAEQDAIVELFLEEPDDESG